MEHVLTDIHDYADAWSQKMIEIWLEKIERRHIRDTGALHESLSEQVTHTAAGATISMKFLEYGLAQEYGVGNGYSHDNGGDLVILDPEYRRLNRLDVPRPAGPRSHRRLSSGNPRKPRPWFELKYFTSILAMEKDLAKILSEEATEMVVENISSSFSKHRD